MSVVSTGLNILSIFWTTVEDQLGYQMSFETLLKSINTEELIEVEISFINGLKKLRSREPCTISCTKDSSLGLIRRSVGSRPAS